MRTFSIITVCLDDRGGLERTAKSLIGQEYQNFQWIVIDGGSTDGTREYLQDNTRVDSFVSEKDKGIYDAMNKGIGHATGEYCLFLNAGDYLCDGAVLGAVYKAQGCDLLIGGVLEYYPEEQVHVRKRFDSLGIGRRSLYYRTLPHSNTFIKKNLFDKYGLYDTEFKLYGDHDFFARAVKHRATMSFVDCDVTVFVKDGISSSTAKHTALARGEMRRLRKKNYPLPYRLYQETRSRLKSLLLYNRKAQVHDGKQRSQKRI